jgi:hypothetical protein
MLKVCKCSISSSGYIVPQPDESGNRKRVWKENGRESKKHLREYRSYMKTPFSTLDLMYNINVNPLFKIVRR